MNKNLVLDLAIMFTLLGIIAYFIVNSTEYRKEYKESQTMQEEISRLLKENIAPFAGVSLSMTNIVNSNNHDILTKYKSFYEINNDMVGFLHIDEDHQYPVLQREDNQNFYLNHDFYKNSSTIGSIFVNKNCSLGVSGITLIYGHHIKRQQMFGILDNFKDEEYFNTHRTLQLDTLYEECEYEVYAVVICQDKDETKYYDYTGTLTDEAFTEWKSYMTTRLKWGSLDSIESTDTIVELSTCSYERKNNRLVVILVKK